MSSKEETEKAVEIGENERQEESDSNWVLAIATKNYGKHTNGQDRTIFFSNH
jgi:hypothetical protein